MKKRPKRLIARTKIYNELNSSVNDMLVGTLEQPTEQHLLPALTKGCETWTASEGDLSRIRAVEMSFLAKAVELGEMEGYRNKCMKEQAFQSELWTYPKMNTEEQ